MTESEALELIPARRQTGCYSCGREIDMGTAAIGTSDHKPRQQAGLGHWMRRVLEECDNAAKDFSADPVHDLRVALRRCRSMADGLMHIDPDKSWRRMKKAGKPLFQALGDLRDAHVMMEWVQSLGAADDPVTRALQSHIDNQEDEGKRKAAEALGAFDRKQWNEWCLELPRRAARIRLGSVVFRHMALERWTEARGLHRRAIRTHSQAALHQLRIGIKRFRYTVENFLPELHHAWSNDLKQLQDWLGEVHDLDVLWATALSIRAFHDTESRSRWHAKIVAERNLRIEKYRQKMVGKETLWTVWRSELPQGKQIEAAALNRLQAWASYLDPDFAHSRQVTAVAAQLYDRLASNGMRLPTPHGNLRDILLAAGLMHDVGRSSKEKDHHKKSLELISQLEPPLGWTVRDLHLAAVVARYHRGALPQSRHKDFHALSLDDQRVAILLAGILRLANALGTHDGRPRKVRVEIRDDTLHLYVTGYSRLSESAQNIAAARHLLEVVLRRPIIVRALVLAGRRTQNARKISALRAAA